SFTTRKRQRWVLPPLAAHTPALKIFAINSSGTGSGFSRRIARVLSMISNRSGMGISCPGPSVDVDVDAVAFRIANPALSDGAEHVGLGLRLGRLLDGRNVVDHE